jgi:dimethylglycine dehydrogenase
MGGGVVGVLALAMLRPDLGEIGSEVEVTILGKPHRATVIGPFDPQNERLRS